MPLITEGHAVEYLDQALGITLPAFIVQAAIDKVDAAEAAMDAAGYDAPTKTMVAAMAVAIIASAGAPRRIQSQGAPSGASRSFKNFDASLSALRRSLLALDTAGTVTALIGPDPSHATLLMVV